MKFLATVLSRTLLFCAVAVAGVDGLATTSAQVPVIGEEVFVTLDADSLTGWTAGLRRFSVRNLDGSIATIDFASLGVYCANGCSLPTYVPLIGAYGPILTDGQYEVEPFLWEQTLGNLGGSWSFFFSSLPPGPILALPFTQVSGPVAGSRMGVRIGRVDRKTIELVAVEYMSADTNFEIGTKLTSYADFASFQSIAPTVIASPSFSWLNLPMVPLVRTVRISPATFAMNPGSGTFSLTATVTGATLDDGTVVDSGVIDALIGGTFSMSGSYIGVDLIGFSDIVLASTTSTLAALGGDQMTWAKSFVIGPDYRALSGPFGTFPLQYRLLDGGESLPPTRNGAGSQLITALRGQFAEEARLRTLIAPTGPVLLSIEFDFQPPSSSVSEHRWATDGSGGLSFGIARGAVGSTFRNLAVVSPTVPIGTGPFFGIEFGPAQLAQMPVPFGTHPIFSAPDAFGSYFWGAPAGSLPAGVIVDLAYLEISSQNVITQTSVTRLFF